MASCMSLEEALEILGPIRAWASKDPQTKPTFWLDGKKTTERAIKVEAHRVWREKYAK